MEFLGVLVMSTLHHDDLKIDHEDVESGESIYRVTSIVNLADRICRRLGIGRREPDETVDVVGCPGAIALELDEKDVQQVIVEIDKVFAENRGSFSG